MTSEKQIAANRENAQNSTGPRTPEGRAAVKLNSVKHGLTASTLVLRGENAADFESLVDAFEAEHAPATPTEVMLVRQMVMAAWRLERLYRVEAAHYTLRLHDLAKPAKRDYPHITDDGRLAMVALCDTQELLNMSRVETRLERSFHKALRELQRLRAQAAIVLTKQTQSLPRPAAPSTPQVEEKQPVPIDRPRREPDPLEPDNIALLP